MNKNTPTVTIVTPTYNSAATLANTIESVLGQTYPHLEYIVVDGNSTDNTPEIVARYANDPRLKYIREPDKGQTDAINKGWAHATGAVFAWLCADDSYLPNTVRTAVDAFNSHRQVMWVYGRDQYINRNGQPVPFHHHFSTWDYEAYLSQQLYISQPTVFWRRGVIEHYGLLRDDLHYGMDMEYFLRIGREFPGHYLPEVLATITWTRQTKTFSGGVARINEIIAIAQQYGATEFAPTIRVQWVDAHLEALFRHLFKGETQQAAGALNAMFTYPRYLLRGASKTIVRYTLPERAEMWLRQAVLR